MTIRNHICRALASIFLLAPLGCSVAGAAEPQRVLLTYNSVGYAEVVTRDIRDELQQRSPKIIETYFAPFVAGHSSDQDMSARYADYLRSLFPDQRLDLAVAVGSPAVSFFLEYGRRIFPSTPLLAIVEESRAPSTPERNETIVTSYLDLAGAIENIVQLLPETTNISVVIGNSPLEEYWLAKEHLAFQPFESRISFRWLNDLSFDELLKYAAALPPRSAILFNSLFSDALGGAYDDHEVVSKLHAVATAPIFSFDVSDFGEGIVGGPWASTEEVSRNYANVALRILGGEALEGLKIPGVVNGPPKFDWREMGRWGISESRLPPGSTIYFRDPTAWEQYRWQITATALVLLIQTALIVALFQQHHRRRLAELQTRQRMAELAHMNRYATAGELAASIGHELNQPLTAIHMNAKAAELMLNSPSPSLDEFKDIVVAIMKDDERASEVLRRLRGLLKKNVFQPEDIDLNETVNEVFAFISVLANARGVALSYVPAPSKLRVRGDRIQLQQVVLNLVVNGMDALAATPAGQRRITGRIRQKDEASAEISVLDSGPGIPSDQLGHIFEPFFTTKNQGMGMGLSISRTIVEAHGGRIWAENRIDGGAVFRLTLPLSVVVQPEKVQTEEA